MFNPSTQPEKISSIIFSTLNQVGKIFLKLALKTLVIMVLWNIAVPDVFVMLPKLDFGHAFILTSLLAFIFTNFNSYDKFININLINFKNQMLGLYTEQSKQINALIYLLHLVNTRLELDDKTVPLIEPVVDITDESNYNDQESEK